MIAHCTVEDFKGEETINSANASHSRKRKFVFFARSEKHGSCSRRVATFTAMQLKKHVRRESSPFLRAWITRRCLPRVSLESLNPLPEKETEIAISRPTMYIISANSLSTLQLKSVSIRVVVHLLLYGFSVRFSNDSSSSVYVLKKCSISHAYLEHGF